MEEPKWITPFMKQCFVTAGVSINLAQFSSVLGFTAVLLPQLRESASTINIDEVSASWIAAIPGIALIIGNLIIPTIMAKYGRKAGNIISIIPVIIGWICIVTAKNVSWIIFARLLQGLSMGMSTSLGPILVGEYTSPKNRGPFLSTLSLILSITTLVVHAVGSYFTWRATALLCTVITFIDLLIVLFSPESPSWLAEQGRYEDCRKTFRCLRGDSEEDELNKMIETNKNLKESNQDDREPFVKKTKQKIKYFYRTVKKKEFYKPIFIMVHLYTICEWGGINILSPYLLDVVNLVVSDCKSVGLQVILLDVQRLFSSAAAIYIITRIKRRTLLFTTTGLCVITLLVTDIYIYCTLDSDTYYLHYVNLHICADKNVRVI